MNYLSLAQRVPEISALESSAASRFYSLLSRLPLMRAAHRRILAGVLALGVARGRCLDVGTGPGSVALELARRNPALCIVGLDLAAPMLRLALAEGSRMDSHGHQLWPQADGHLLPFASGSFDLVTSAFSLHHWLDPVRVLDEIARVLAPGGRYYIADLCREAKPFQRLFAWGSIPFVSLPFGSYRGYGGYYESLRAGYNRAEARQLLEHSALPPGRVDVNLTQWIPTLAIASQGSA
jgi:ubiquinone/menaquinone biosynthesis C-methylase UbiE